MKTVNDKVEKQIVSLKTKLIELESDLSLLNKNSGKTQDVKFLAKKESLAVEIGVLKVEIRNLESLRIEFTKQNEHDSLHGRTSHLHQREGENSTHRQPELYAGYNRADRGRSGKK